MVDTLKFTSKSKVWNNFCAGCSIKEIPRHLSPDLYSGRAKGQVWGILLAVTNDPVNVKINTLEFEGNSLPSLRKLTKCAIQFDLQLTRNG